jgi:hypothetical protein
MKLFLYGVVSLHLIASSALADLTIVRDGQPRAAIFVPKRLLDDATTNPEPVSVWRKRTTEDHRRRLRESVKDLAGILQRISGAKIDIVAGNPGGNERRVPILIGELAEKKFGEPQQTFPFQQGFRIVVANDGIGLIGESDLATSYAIYTLLDQIGCRWYMPSEMGEVLPSLKTITLQEQDVSTGPYTIYRGMWYCDNDFARRNRMGGMELAAGHALEGTVPKKLREEHPEIRAIIGGKPHPRKVKWTHPLVATGIADELLARLEKDPNIPTFSLSPDDGIGWDESDDTKHDTGDFDPATQMVSKSDRLILLTSRVAERVTAKYPHVKFGVLAYADYTRPPLRQKVHPAVVPQIAPITFSRAQPMTDDGEPNNKALRYLVEGWGKAAPATSYYFYGFNLAEVSSPNPMIAKWSTDIPIIYKKGNCRYWQPETITNFETTFHAHYLGQRMAWDPTQDPAKIIDELHDKFYGHAAKDMAQYWHHIDDAWTKTPEYAGCGFGHLHRWTKERLAKAREIMDRAIAHCQTESEKSRVLLASESLTQFERFMKLRRDLADGRFASLAEEAEQYRQRLNALAEQYESQFAFAKMRWTRDRTLGVRYFDAFYKKTYDDASRIAAKYVILKSPIRNWRIRVDKSADKDKAASGELAGWHQTDFDDSKWRTTDCAIDTWSKLGLHNYMGSLWYRARISTAKGDRNKPVKLWLAATDGRVKVFVNGKHIVYKNDKGEVFDTFSGYCQPVSFDITTALNPAGDNQISLLCTREFLNELGTGGLLGPAMIYQ